MFGIKAPDPLFTSNTRAPKPSAIFFDIIEATIRGTDSTVEVASRNVRQILDDVSNDLRVLGNDDTGQRQRTAETQKDAHDYADAIHQMIDGVKDLIKQTEHTGGGLNSALTAFISPDGHTAR